MITRTKAAVAAAALSAAALWFGTGLHPLWWIMWVAPLPVLLAAPAMGAWATFGMATGAWCVGELNVWTYLHRLEIPTPLILGFLIIPAVIFGVSVVLYRTFLRRGQLWQAIFVMPALWVTYEFLWSSQSPHSTFFNVGYTQMDCLPILQVVSLTGIWGISFCLFLLPASIAALTSGLARSSQRIRLGGTVGFVLIAVTAYGWWRLSYTPPADQSVKVALAASDVIPSNSEAAEKLLREYSDKVDVLAAAGAELIVLPEKIAVVSDEGTGHWDGILGASAARGNATLVVGIDRGSAKRRWNEARVYSRSGAVEGVYDKHHMIPGFEDVDQAGSKVLVLRQPSGVWGVEICKDMDFPALSRQYGREGVGLLVVPAWDFVVDGRLHGRMAVMRGTESGFTVVRSAKQGLLTVSDDRGRILAEHNSSSEPMSSLVATVPVRHSDTPYARLGNWFAWVNVAGLLVILPGLRKRAK